MKWIVLILSAQLCASINILHYNIKELDTLKFESSSAQLTHLAEVIKLMKPDLFSVNEIQYDTPTAPLKRFNSTGENLNKLSKRLKLSLEYSAFSPANTGVKAKRKADGNYATDSLTQENRALADQVNFGVFPHQYSNGLLSKYPIKNVKRITQLRWNQFERKLDLSQFKSANGSALPANMELFDKSFTDVTIDYEGKELHIILLHTVPAYGFGNKFTPNFARNAAQLRFLEWYITGKTEHEVRIDEIKPLAKNSLFIIMGDLNTDIKNDKAGSLVLKRIIKSAQNIFPATYPTHLSGKLRKSHRKSILDYMIVSKQFKVQVLQSELPKKNLKRHSTRPAPQKDRVVISDEIGIYSVSKQYYDLRMASDHLPLYVTLSLD